MSFAEEFTFAYQILQGLILIVGVPLVIIQIRQQTQAIKIQSQSIHISIYMQLMQEGTRISQLALDDEELSEFYDESKLPKKLSGNWQEMGKKYHKYYFYLGRNLSLLEQAFILWNLGWIDITDYRAILERLFEIIGLKKFEAWWETMKPYYRLDFGSYVDSLKGHDKEDFFELALKKVQRVVF